MHTHYCPYCEGTWDHDDPDCGQPRSYECDYCFADGERDLTPSAEDYL